MAEVRVDGSMLRLPVTVHANYCNGKSKELDIRGLWMYDETIGKNTSNHNGLSKSQTISQCKSYNVSNTYFATKNFTAAVELIEIDRLGILKSVLVNGTLLKRY